MHVMDSSKIFRHFPDKSVIYQATTPPLPSPPLPVLPTYPQLKATEDERKKQDGVQAILPEPGGPYTQRVGMGRSLVEIFCPPVRPQFDFRKR